MTPQSGRVVRAQVDVELATELATDGPCPATWVAAAALHHDRNHRANPFAAARVVKLELAVVIVAASALPPSLLQVAGSDEADDAARAINALHHSLVDVALHSFLIEPRPQPRRLEPNADPGNSSVVVPTVLVSWPQSCVRKQAYAVPPLIGALMIGALRCRTRGAWTQGERTACASIRTSSQHLWGRLSKDLGEDGSTQTHKLTRHSAGVRYLDARGRALCSHFISFFTTLKKEECTKTATLGPRRVALAAPVVVPFLVPLPRLVLRGGRSLLSPLQCVSAKARSFFF